VGRAARAAEWASARRGPPPGAHRGLVEAGPFLHGAIEIVVARIAALHRRLHIGDGERMAVAQVRDRERPARAVKFIGAALVILRPAEIGQDVAKAPAGVAELAPMVEVFGLPADIDETVDRARPAEDFSARCNHVSAVTAR